jgi:hypothetical protein
MHAICWIRDYTNGYVIETIEQMEALLLNEPNRLRISFFSYPLENMEELRAMAARQAFPSITDQTTIPTGAEVLTLWFHNYKPYLSRSGIENIDLLFTDMAASYRSCYIDRDIEALEALEIDNISDILCMDALVNCENKKLRKS